MHNTIVISACVIFKHGLFSEFERKRESAWARPAKSTQSASTQAQIETRKFVYYLPSDPLYAPLRDQVRFRRLVALMGLECVYHPDGTHECFESM